MFSITTCTPRFPQSMKSTTENLTYLKEKRMLFAEVSTCGGENEVK
jgi:hypothetical protein